VVNIFSLSGYSVNPFRAIRIGNRPVSRGVLLERRGALTIVLITPKDPEKFCEDLSARLGEVPPDGPSCR
jgi:hypothetical protein